MNQPTTSSRILDFVVETLFFLMLVVMLVASRENDLAFGVVLAGVAFAAFSPRHLFKPKLEEPPRLIRQLSDDRRDLIIITDDGTIERQTYNKMFIIDAREMNGSEEPKINHAAYPTF